MKFLYAIALSLPVLLSACSDSSNNKEVVDLTPLLERYILSSEDSVPEGITFDSVDRAFYVTSLQGGSLVKIDADGTESIFREADNMSSWGGTKVDTVNRRLWVCGQVDDTMGDRVSVYDLGSGAMTMQFLLNAVATDGECNDLALDSAGNAYVTDPSNPNLYMLDPVTGEGSLLATDPLFTDVSTLGLGLNGIAVTADDSYLIVGKFALASLFRVSLPGGDDITPIALTGDVFPSPDGLVLLDGDLFTVSGNSVSRVQFDPAYTAGSVTVAPQISGLSTGTLADGELYVVKSEVTNFVLGLPLNTPFEIFRVDRSVFEQ